MTRRSNLSIDPAHDSTTGRLRTDKWRSTTGRTATHQTPTKTDSRGSAATRTPTDPLGQRVRRCAPGAPSAPRATPTAPASSRETPTTPALSGTASPSQAAPRGIRGPGPHDSETDCWIAVNGVVYDTNPYLAEHPGGAQSIPMNAGQECSEEFTAIHSRKAWAKLDKYAIRKAIGNKASKNG